MKIKLFTHLKHIASPGAVPENMAIIGSYLVILALFPLDIITGSHISLHLIYIFPLFLIAIHSSRNSWVAGAAFLSITLQLITLVIIDSDRILAIKIYLMLMIILTNSAFALIARSARTNTLEAERLSAIDPLTKLYNRRTLDIAINSEIVRQRRYGGCFSVALIDLDGFKGLNDSLGHDAGDKALILLADVLKAHTRQSDTIARIGGDEFVILMPNTQASDCDILCQLLCNKISNCMKDVSFSITASIGYTTIERSATLSKDILSIADKAMYEAKSNGKGQVVRGYSPTDNYLTEEYPEKQLLRA